VTAARDRIAELLASALDGVPPPPAPPVRARELVPLTQKRARRRRARDARARRADAVERLQAAASRGAATVGDAYRAPPRMNPRAWQLATAIVRDTSGRTAATALSTLPLALRHRAQRELARDVRRLEGRYRVALLVGLHALSRAHRSRRRPRRVVEGFARSALCSLVRSPADGRALCVSRVFSRSVNGAPLLPWLVDRGLVAREQPGRGARGVYRGPSGYALGVYYLDGDELHGVEELDGARGAPRARANLAPLRAFLARPPD
jgi:hypothetical protein